MLAGASFESLLGNSLLPLRNPKSLETEKESRAMGLLSMSRKNLEASSLLVGNNPSSEGKGSGIVALSSFCVLLR